MIILKLTVLSFVLTAIMVWIIGVWAKADLVRATKAQITGKYPKWMILPFGFLIIFDVGGIIAGVIWFLFFM